MGMGQVVSFADARAAKVKAKLCSFATTRKPSMVETHDGMIDARRIFCRDAVAILIDRYGYQTRIGYDAITDVSPILPVAEIVRLADWQAVEAEEVQEQVASVLPFRAQTD